MGSRLYRKRCNCDGFYLTIKMHESFFIVLEDFVYCAVKICPFDIPAFLLVQFYFS